MGALMVKGVCCLALGYGNVCGTPAMNLLMAWEAQPPRGMITTSAHMCRKTIDANI